MLKQAHTKPTEKENNQAAKSNKTTWLPYKDLLIHGGLFKRGIVAVTPKHTAYRAVDEDKNFHFKDRQFVVYRQKDLARSNSAPNVIHYRQAQILLSQLKILAGAQSGVSYTSNDIAIYSKRHKEEIFLPFNSKNQNEQELGMYLYPWVSEFSENMQLSGFSAFHTVGCLFGSALKGMDQNGAIFELIKHDIKFYPTQKITMIIHNPQESNPYEEMLFQELDKLTSMMRLFSNNKEKIKLNYHMPSLDYVLFGIELYIAGRITFKALNDFFIEIRSKKIEIVQKISKICEKNGIEVLIESPFENLFGPVHESENMAQAILECLGLPLNDFLCDQPIEHLKSCENELVELCLFKLRNNSYHSKHRQVWADFYEANGNKIHNIEALLKMGNAVMVGVTCFGYANFEACSFTPLSEKQIQLEYKEYQEKIKNNNKIQSSNYPVNFNITTFEPIIAYSSTTKDLPTKDLTFYFNQCSGTLVELITDKKLLGYAGKNIGLFANKTKMANDEFLSEFLKQCAVIESLNPFNYRVIFTKEADAKTFQTILMQKGYTEPNASSKPRSISKISKSANPNSNAVTGVSKISYAIKITVDEYKTIFSDHEKISELIAEKPIEIERVIGPSRSLN